MKYSYIVRFLALMCVAALLSGCGLGSASKKSDSVPIAVPATDPVTEPAAIQEPMPQAQLQDALARTEYAMIAAALSAYGRIRCLEGYMPESDVYVGDIDGDNRPELTSTYASMTFELDDGRDFHYQFTQSDPLFYIDEDNVFHQCSYMGDGWPEEMSDGYFHCWEYFYYAFSVWKNGQWTTVLRTSGETLQEAWDNPGGTDLLYGEYLQYDVSWEVDGEEATEEEYNSRRDKLTKITTKPSDYTVNIYDAVYADSLLSALESRFRSDFGASVLHQDIDGDGQTETLFALPDLFAPYEAINDKNQGEIWYDEGVLSRFGEYTGILIADIQGDRLILTAHAASPDVRLYEGMTVEYRDNCLWLGSTAIYAPGSFETLEALSDTEQTAVYNGLVNFLNLGGYTQAVFKKADISDTPGSELLCLCQKDGTWCVLVIIFQNGIPHIVNNIRLDSSAVYLTEIDGKQAILDYNQFIFTTTDGYSRTNYHYTIYRYDQNRVYAHIGGDSVGYSDDDKDATEIAAFFQKLNGYLANIIVISDPFRLQGNQWLSPEEADHGTPPQEPEPEQAEEYVMGFVQINDPSSWLNLREGPGTEYPCILMDPGNPESFVRQALGSPVTVLETIETGDPENPVWLKIRITYADKIIEGYSSKTYIRLANEE